MSKIFTVILKNLSFFQLLNDTNHLVKCNCLSLFGELTPINALHGDWVKFICEYTKSQDPRVRTSAYNAMVS